MATLGEVLANLVRSEHGWEMLTDRIESVGSISRARFDQLLSQRVIRSVGIDGVVFVWKTDVLAYAKRWTREHGSRRLKTMCRHGHDLSVMGVYESRRPDGGLHRRCRVCVVQRELKRQGYRVPDAHVPQTQTGRKVHPWNGVFLGRNRAG